MLIRFFQHLSTLLKKPLFWLFFVLIIFTLKGGSSQEVIRSDGRGYYAYLPSILIYDDASYEKTILAEQKYTDKNQLYLYQTADGKIFNKYFPGLAVMELPFFIGASIVSYAIGYPIDGYSEIYNLFTLFASLFYTILGLLLFKKNILSLFNVKEKNADYFILFSVLSTSLFYYFTVTPAFTHQYSFFLFNLLFLLILKSKNRLSKKHLLFIGVTLGMIFLVRPTNILITLAIPLIFSSFKEFSTYLKNIFNVKTSFLYIGLIGFLIPVSLLFMVWKWQTGEWIVWGYSQEGFNFFSPKIIENLLSFRIGLLIHHPIYILSFIGLHYMYKESSFKAKVWLFYFLVNLWVISSWWCWDYESNFGNRPLTEHAIILLFPLGYLLKNNRKLGISFLILFSLLGTYRYYQAVSGSYSLQRFTASSYFKSLAFWKQENNNRWDFTQTTRPYGTNIETFYLKTVDEKTEINEKEEYYLSSKIRLKKNRTNELYYYYVELDKKIEASPLQEFFLVIDAVSDDGEFRYYKAINVYQDKFEGEGKWKNVVLSGVIHDNFQEADEISIYFWNKGKQNLEIKNLKLRLEVYKAK